MKLCMRRAASCAMAFRNSVCRSGSLTNSSDQLKHLGVVIETNVIVGKTLTMQELEDEGFQAVFIGSGAGLPKFMGILGETAAGVFSANEVLTRVNLMKASPRGSSDALLSKQSHDRRRRRQRRNGRRALCPPAGQKVTVVYRRSLAEMPARKGRSRACDGRGYHVYDAAQSG